MENFDDMKTEHKIDNHLKNKYNQCDNVCFRKQLQLCRIKSSDNRGKFTGKITKSYDNFYPCLKKVVTDCPNMNLV